MIVPRHRLLQLLGRGGMGEVWLAERVSELGATKLVALKLLGFARTSEEGYRMFLNEARVSMWMNHPNVVQVFDAGLAEGRGWLDLELVEGVDLSRICAALRAAQHLPSEAAIAHLSRGLLRGLAHAHSLQTSTGTVCVVHRDVSPQNVLVSFHGQVKVTDFGIARVAETITSSTTVKGKLRYMAPEQARGVSTPAVDLFGVGAVLHELLEGKKFRSDVPAHEMLAAALQGVVAPMVRPVCGPLRELCIRLLAVDPRDRFASAAAALDHLDHHGLTADATSEWASLSQWVRPQAIANDSARSPSPSTLSGESTEAGTDAATGATAVDRNAPTRTNLEARARPVWVVPVAGVVGLVCFVSLGTAAWKARPGAEEAASSMPTLEFDTGYASCDELLHVLGRCQAEGQLLYTEPMLRSMEKNFRRQTLQGASAAYVDGSCAQALETYAPACPKP